MSIHPSNWEVTILKKTIVFLVLFGLWACTTPPLVTDTLENTLHYLVCSGQVPLDTARQAIARDWVAAYHQFVGETIIAVTGVPTEP